MIKVPGFKASGVSSGVKNKSKKDLALIYAEAPAKAAGVFTKNLVKAPPVLLGMERVKSGLCQAVLVNSGIANAFTGKEGYRDSVATSKSLAQMLKIDEELVIPCSTGVIGGRIQVGKMIKAYPDLLKRLRHDGFMDFALGIMTTDDFPKYASTTLKIGGKTGTIAVVGKGAGMIAPNMATMLAYVLTDIDLTKGAMSKALKTSVDDSFNKIIVDGDTSTNDTVLLLSSGLLGNKTISKSSGDYKKFLKALTEVCSEVAEMIVKDGEGATKVVKITVKGARTEKDAQKIARVLGSSIILKSAFFGEDPNWGRIVAGAGMSGVKFDPEKLDLYFDKHKVLSKSKVVMNEKKAHDIMHKDKFEVTLNINTGKESSFVIASDLTFDYIKINAHYRT